MLSKLFSEITVGQRFYRGDLEDLGTYIKVETMLKDGEKVNGVEVYTGVTVYIEEEESILIIK